MDRRGFLKLAGGSTLAAALPSPPQAHAAAAESDSVATQGRADYTLRIGTGLVEVAPGRIL